MRKTRLKHILLTVKIVLAAVLLAWVLSKAHWGDYVLARDGSTWGWLSKTPGGKQFVAEGYLSAVLAGRTSRKTKVFLPDEYVAANPTAPKEDLAARYVRPGLATCLGKMNLWLFCLAVLAFPASIFIVAYRFWFLLLSQGVRIRLWESVRLTFLGQFFNMVVPGTVGGDLVKAWYVSKHTHRTAGVIVTIFVDRLVGLIELVLMAAVMLAIVLALGWETFERMRRPAVTVAVVAAITAAVLAFLFSGRLRKILHLQKLYVRLPLQRQIKSLGKAVRLFSRRPAALFWALVTTLVSHIFFIGGIALIGVALRLDVPFYSYFVYLPLVYILGAVPITPGGVGWVENLYVEFFRCTAVSLSAVVALAMLARIIPTLWGLPGLVVAVRGPKLPKPEEMKAELEKNDSQEA